MLGETFALKIAPISKKIVPDKVILAANLLTTLLIYNFNFKQMRPVSRIFFLFFMLAMTTSVGRRSARLHIKPTWSMHFTLQKSGAKRG